MTPPEAYSFNLKVVAILTFGFALGSIFGYIAQRIKLSPILGYLLAGYMIGPFSPGFVADLELAEQLAEVGVVLMMFGVGLHFRWQDLFAVKKIAVPGAIGQTLVAAAAATMMIYQIGGSWQVGAIMGLAIGVASTVVLVRELSEHQLLNTLQGHIAVGWLIVEDILTVAFLILLPTFAKFLNGGAISMSEIAVSMASLLLKFILLAALMFTIGRKVVSYALLKIARTRSEELFTVTTLALIFVIATGSSFLFGTSIALGSFLAGMVIGQTQVRHQASAYASPLKDVFVVIFFLSVGMLFNPLAIVDNFPLFITVLAIILILKPLTAFFIVKVLRYPIYIAFTIAIALAQIGEFSFILAEEALKFNVFTDEAYDIIVACALISIALNPLLFTALNYLKPYTKEKESSNIQRTISDKPKSGVKALVIGFGVIGRTAVKTLEHLGYRPVIIDRNVDTIIELIEEQREAVYGDASFPKMLEMAKVESASLLVITIPDLIATLNIIKYAREIHPRIIIIARARHVEEQYTLMEAGAKFVCCDDEEVSQAFSRALSRFELPLSLYRTT